MHWVLDVALKEDDYQIRKDNTRQNKDNARQNFAVMRQIAVSLLGQEKPLN
ncbi:hypothetical protein AAFM79_19700 [Trichormus azollae HNT15244]